MTLLSQGYKRKRHVSSFLENINLFQKHVNVQERKMKNGYFTFTYCNVFPSVNLILILHAQVLPILKI